MNLKILLHKGSHNALQWLIIHFKLYIFLTFQKLIIVFKDFIIIIWSTDLTSGVYLVSFFFLLESFDSKNKTLNNSQL